MKITKTNRLLIIFINIFFASSYLHLLYFYSTHIYGQVHDKGNNLVQPNSTEKVIRVIDGNIKE
jgi:hypothetical protein